MIVGQRNTNDSSKIFRDIVVSYFMRHPNIVKWWIQEGDMTIEIVIKRKGEQTT